MMVASSRSLSAARGFPRAPALRAAAAGVGSFVGRAAGFIRQGPAPAQ
jgi:hypothetical protein